MTTYAGDQQMRSYQGASRVDTMIKRVLYSLSLLNDDYDNPYAARVRRTQVSYW
jgi:hypothetical protein